MNNAISQTTNAIRILIAILFLLIFVSDLRNIYLDPDTYYKVYTGEFLGEGRFNSLFNLVLSHCVTIAIVFTYLLFVFLHLTKLKSWKVLTWILRVIDILISIIIIGYIIPNIVSELFFKN